MLSSCAHGLDYVDCTAHSHIPLHMIFQVSLLFAIVECSSVKLLGNTSLSRFTVLIYISRPDAHLEMSSEFPEVHIFFLDFPTASWEWTVCALRTITAAATCRSRLDKLQKWWHKLLRIGTNIEKPFIITNRPLKAFTVFRGHLLIIIVNLLFWIGAIFLFNPSCSSTELEFTASSAALKELSWPFNQN